MPNDLPIDPLLQFGVAGLMGLLWIWERWMSRKREQQLDDAHHRLMAERRELSELVALVQRNTQAIERFSQTQLRLHDLLEDLRQRRSRRAAPSPHVAPSDAAVSP